MWVSKYQNCAMVFWGHHYVLACTPPQNMEKSILHEVSVNSGVLVRLTCTVLSGETEVRIIHAFLHKTYGMYAFISQVQICKYSEFQIKIEYYVGIICIRIKFNV